MIEQFIPLIWGVGIYVAVGLVVAIVTDVTIKLSPKWTRRFYFLCYDGEPGGGHNMPANWGPGLGTFWGICWPLVLSYILFKYFLTFAGKILVFIGKVLGASYELLVEGITNFLKR